MGAHASDPDNFDQAKIGYPFSNNPYWKMAREGRTNDLLKQFQTANIDCYQVIEESSHHTLVHQAIILDRRQLFKLCEVYGADWNQTDINGVTPLMKAAALNRDYFFDKLLELGAKVDVTDKKGRNAQFYAKMYRNEDLVQKLEEFSKQ